MIEEDRLSTEGVDNKPNGPWMPQLQVVLALSIVLSLPAIAHFLNGQLGVTSALFDYLLALIISWIGLIVVGSIVGFYIRPVMEAEERRRLEGEEAAAAALGEGDDLENLRAFADPLGDHEDAGDLDEQSEDELE